MIDITELSISLIQRLCNYLSKISLVDVFFPIFILFIGIVLNKLALKIIHKLVRHTRKIKTIDINTRKRLATLVKLLEDFVKVVVWGALIIILLSHYGIDTAPLLTGAGIVGLAIGIGSKELVKDLVSGFFILFEGTFDKGDFVELGGVKGKVYKLGIRTTTLKDYEGNIYIVPNGQISKIVKYKTKPPWWGKKQDKE